MNPLADIWQYRQALWNFVVQRLKVRYKRSFLGFFWSFINPLLLIATYLVVFKYIFPHSEKNYSVKLFTTLLAWRFFQAVIMDGGLSVAGRLALIKQVNFPRIILPTSSLIANFIDYLLSLIILVIVFAAARVTVNWPYLPLAIMALFSMLLFAYGLSLILATLSVYYTDVQFLIGNLFQMWFFLSPVLYPAAWVVGKHLPKIYETIYFLNPPATMLMAFRSIIPEQEPQMILLDYYKFFIISAAISVVILFVGLVLFRRYEARFAKEV